MEPSCLLAGSVRHMVIKIIKGISTAPISYISWEHRVLYNNTNNTHTHTHTHMHVSGGVGGTDMAVKHMQNCTE